MNARRLFVLTLVFTAAAHAGAARAADCEVQIKRSAGVTRLNLSAGNVFREAPGQVVAPRAVAVPGSLACLAMWDERLPSGALTPHYAVSLN